MGERNKPRTRKRNITEGTGTVTRRGEDVGGKQIGGGFFDKIRKAAQKGLTGDGKEDRNGKSW